MSDGTRKVRLVWGEKGPGSGVDIEAYEFKMNPIPRAGDQLCVTLPGPPRRDALVLLVVGVVHHVTPIVEGHDVIHHVDLFVEVD